MEFFHFHKISTLIAARRGGINLNLSKNVITGGLVPYAFISKLNRILGVLLQRFYLVWKPERQVVVPFADFGWEANLSSKGR